ncbi:hypothetical protein GGI43DRAFT_247385 [Trichoderma evansii]
MQVRSSPGKLSRLEERHGRKRAELRPATANSFFLLNKGGDSPGILARCWCLSLSVLYGAAITGAHVDANGRAGAATAHWVVPYLEGCCKYRLGADLRATSSGAILRYSRQSCGVHALGAVAQRCQRYRWHVFQVSPPLRRDALAGGLNPRK